MSFYRFSSFFLVVFTFEFVESETKSCSENVKDEIGHSIGSWNAPSEGKIWVADEIED